MDNLKEKKNLVVLDQVLIIISLQCSVMENLSCCNLDNSDILREVIVKIGLKKIDTQEKAMVEALLDGRVMGLVISLEFARKQEFKLKKNRKTNIYEECGWFLQQREANLAHSGDIYLLSGAQGKNKD